MNFIYFFVFCLFVYSSKVIRFSTFLLLPPRSSIIIISPKWLCIGSVSVNVQITMFFEDQKPIAKKIILPTFHMFPIRFFFFLFQSPIYLLLPRENIYLLILLKLRSHSCMLYVRVGTFILEVRKEKKKRKPWYEWIIHIFLKMPFHTGLLSDRSNQMKTYGFSLLVTEYNHVNKFENSRRRIFYGRNRNKTSWKIFNLFNKNILVSWFSL